MEEHEDVAMAKITIAVATVLALAAAVPAANATGCLKGAVVGGVAGHFVGKGHGLLGAGAGCAIGHHESNKQAHEQQPQDTTAGSGSSSH
jgi:hypothetical protein